MGMLTIVDISGTKHRQSPSLERPLPHEAPMDLPPNFRPLPGDRSTSEGPPQLTPIVIPEAVCDWGACADRSLDGGWSCGWVRPGRYLWKRALTRVGPMAAMHPAATGGRRVGARARSAARERRASVACRRARSAARADARRMDCARGQAVVEDIRASRVRVPPLAYPGAPETKGPIAGRGPSWSSLQNSARSCPSRRGATL